MFKLIRLYLPLIEIVLSLLPISTFATPTRPSFAPRLAPRLAVILVIDQFRADYLFRYKNRFLSPIGSRGAVGGFRYLMEKGAYFPYGEHSNLQNMTCPGHATILSGSYPYQSGISLNHWYDSKTKKEIYCVEDPDSPLVHSSPNSLPSKETDEKVSRMDFSGRSPKNFIGTTVGDELKNAGYPGKVVTLALKDRSAILLGGHRADLAFWLNMKTTPYQWVTSRHYLPEGDLPTWMQRLNHSIAPLFAGSSDLKQVQRSLNTSFGIELTEKAAEEAILAYELGTSANPERTDLLAISFSSHDLAGHDFGPNSSEMETLTLAEDRILSRFLNFLRIHLPHGLSDAIIVLTGDHGIPPHPQWLKSSKLPSGRIFGETLATSLSVYLNEKFGRPSLGSWVTAEEELNFYLNESALSEKKLDREKVEAESKAFLGKTPGIAYAITSSDILNRRLPPEILQDQILRTYYPGRNGDVILIPKPFFFSSDLKSQSVNHMTGYSYDRMVPILFAGLRIKAGTYLGSAHVIDIAPTLSWLLGVLPPSLSEGRILAEFLVK